MASLTQDPNQTASQQGARRDSSLLRRAYRMNRRRDPLKALQIAREADAMGLAVGRPVNDRNTEGAGDVRYMAGLRESGASPSAGGLDGYNFNQQAGRDLQGFAIQTPGDSPRRRRTFGYDAETLQKYATDDSGSGYSIPGTPSPGQQLSSGFDPRQRREQDGITSGFRERWQQLAGDQNAQDAIVEEAARAGVPLSDAGRSAMERRRSAGPSLPSPAPGAMGAPSMQRPGSNLLPPPRIAGYGQGQRGFDPSFDEQAGFQDMRNQYAQQMQRPGGQVAKQNLGSETIENLKKRLMRRPV